MPVRHIPSSRSRQATVSRSQRAREERRAERGAPVATHARATAYTPGPRTGLQFPASRSVEIDFEKILNLRGTIKGSKVLLVGCGPSGATWRGLMDQHTLVACVNSALPSMAKDIWAYFCTEGNGYELPWFWTPTDAIKLVSYCNLKRPERDRRVTDYAAREDVYPIERSWHLAGFDPLNYINSNCIPDEIFNHPQRNLYELHRTYIGCDRTNKKEWGLLKGPVCFPGLNGARHGMSVGTVLVNALHALAFMGAAEVHTIGFELCQKESVDHWTEPKFRYVPTIWSPPECFVKVNGYPTLWHFALSAAFAMKMKPKFLCAGMRWEDHSQGLMDIPNIASILTEVHQKPHDIDLEKSKLPEGKVINTVDDAKRELAKLEAPPVKPQPKPFAGEPLGLDATLKFWREEFGNQVSSYLEINDDRTDRLLAILKGFRRNWTFLEVGCGPGRNLEALRKSGYKNLAGIEISGTAVSLLAERFPVLAESSEIINKPIEEAIREMEDRSKDVIFSMAVLQHIHPDSEYVFAEMARVASKYIITIECENYSTEKSYPRKYKEIFEALGFEQDHIEALEQIPVGGNFGPYIARRFRRKGNKAKVADTEL